MRWLLLVFLLLKISKGFRRVCYFPNWAPFREHEAARLPPEEFDASLCTHIHIAFADIDPDSLQLLPTQNSDVQWKDKIPPLFERMVTLKKQNPRLKVLLAVGGWNAKSAGFNAVTRSAYTRQRFVFHVIRFLRAWKFDGIDLDWEYPGDNSRGAQPNSKDGFDKLIKDFRQAFDVDAGISRSNRLLLVSAVAADRFKAESAYHIQSLCRNLDYVNLMTYDYHGPWDDVTGHNAPLFASKFAFPNERERNINASVHFYQENGCPPEKLVVGIAAYGRTFSLALPTTAPTVTSTKSTSTMSTTTTSTTSSTLPKDQSTKSARFQTIIVPTFDLQRTLPSLPPFPALPFNYVHKRSVAHQESARLPISGPGKQGTYTLTPGVLSYYEVCDKLYLEGWAQLWDEGAQVPYAVLDDQWMSYDDLQSVTVKAEYIVNRRLGGAMIWSVDFDDFNGKHCYLDNFPLMTVLKSMLASNDTEPPAPLHTEHTESTVPPTTEATTEAPQQEETEPSTQAPEEPPHLLNQTVEYESSLATARNKTAKKPSNGAGTPQRLTAALVFFLRLLG